MNLIEAATIPVAYLTAAFSLLVKAGLRRGQSVLIHAAAGAVGHAAVSLAQHYGWRILATCSPQKRAYVIEKLHVVPEDVASSRSVDFLDTVLRRTGGRGVDCVLNCLSGSLMEASLEALAPNGHFVEIGKVDFERNARIGIRALARNCSYHAVDLAPMFSDPAAVAELRTLLAGLLEAGAVRPLPPEIFADPEVALRRMAAAKHIGKVLLDIPAAVPQRAPTLTRYVTSGAHLVIGGLGGLGLELARWLLACGADEVLLASRRGGPTTAWQRLRLPCQTASRIRCVAFDAAGEGTDAAAELLRSASLPVIGIWHSAMVLNSRLFENMTTDAWDGTVDVKVNGIRALSAASVTLAPELREFVFFSSLVASHGNRGQANYAWANRAGERVVEERRKSGLPGLAIRWGAIDSVGHFKDLPVEKRSTLKTRKLGLDLQPVDESLDALHQLLFSEEPVVACFKEVRNVRIHEGGHATAPPSAKTTLEGVVARLARILGETPALMNVTRPLGQLGLDSLSRVEIQNWLRSGGYSFAITPEHSITDIHTALGGTPQPSESKLSEEKTDTEA
jgi:fatty acid synthase